MKVIVILFVLCVSVYGQGQQCQNPVNEAGTCVILPECPYLTNLYRQYPGNREVINFLVGSQRSCGGTSVGRNPIVCCTKPQGTVQQPDPTPATRQAGRNCNGPDKRPGTCISIRECQHILTEFSQKQQDSNFIKYIQLSNTICDQVQPNICCPFDTSPVTFTEDSASGTNSDSSPNPQSLSPRLLSAEEGCGFANVTHTRIVGGEPAKLGAWPWMALIGYTNNIDISWSCGGSLITTQHVLTAAHCLRSNLRVVRLGEHDLSSETETTTIDVDVVKVVKYPEYSPRDGHNDLAVLYMAHPVEITLKIRPICLPISGTIRSKSFIGYQPFVAGWGRTQEGGKSANILQELQVPVLTNEVCKDRYKKVGKLISEQQFDDAVLCAGVLTGGKDSCQGDSGGPLMAPTIIDGHAYFYQIGIVSYGIGCARVDVPGVYTKVQTFVDWIEARVAEPIQ